ncbi:PIN domain-containing protein [Cunninghamella echinulata]|nr:PIN domain-containing protein [Cunninghamella echinulata]
MNYMDVDGPEFLLEVNQAISAIRSQSLINKDILQNEEQSYWSSTHTQNNYQQVIVLDTNFLISNLGFLQELITIAELRNDCLLIVPWVVIQELDGLKKSHSKQSTKGKQERVDELARKAMRFLEGLLVKQSPALRGQKTNEIYDNDNIKTYIGDDCILDCCLYFRYKLEKPVKLLSNDRNLCIKAMVHCIEAISSESKIKLKELLELVSLGQNVMQIEPSIHFSSTHMGPPSTQHQTIIDEDCEMIDSPVIIIEDNAKNITEDIQYFNGGGTNTSKYAPKNYNNNNNTLKNINDHDKVLSSRKLWHNVYYKTGMDLEKK